jgi:fluoroquinolone transport system permease protein
MRVVLAFARNDLRSVGRDSLLVGAALAPWLLVAGVRLLVPAATAWLANAHGVDLVPYYPLLLSLLCLLNIPLLFGMMTGFLMLEERDDRVLAALRVTPLSLRRYLLYRLGTALLLSTAVILIGLPLTGLMAAPVWPPLPVLALLGGLTAPLVALLMAAIAGNKVEGMALSKAFGLLPLGALVAFFIDGEWQWLLGVLPSYWPVRAFWLVSAGGAAWGEVAIGVAYHALLLAALTRRLQARLSR